MSLEAQDITVAGTGHVWLADLGTTIPAFGTDLSGVAAWVDLGYITTDGTKFAFKRDTTDIESWQSLDPTRTVVKKVPKSVSFTLQQTGPDQISLALGGGEWTEPVTDVFKYTPPSSSDVDERAMIVELIDGDETFWYVFPRSLNKEGVEFNAQRDKEIGYQITMVVLTPSSGDVYNILTDSLSFAPAS